MKPMSEWQKLRRAADFCTLRDLGSILVFLSEYNSLLASDAKRLAQWLYDWVDTHAFDGECEYFYANVRENAKRKLRNKLMEFYVEERRR